MSIENTVSNDFLFTFVDSINVFELDSRSSFVKSVFNCRLSGVNIEQGTHYDRITALERRAAATTIRCAKY